jgi:sugar phosphate isomerase/epimerase
MNIRHNSNIPFVLGFSLQEYLSAEQGILAADKANFDYWYIDCSLLGESPGDWNAKRIDNMLLMIATHKVQPIVHGNFKLPLASEITELQKTAIDCAKKEIDLAAQLNNAPVIIHGGAIVEPRLVIKSKKKALEHFIKSIESLSDYAIKKNVNLYLENLSNYKNYWPFHYIFTQIEEFDFVFSRINNVSLFLDIGHANVCDGDPISMIKLFHDRIVGMSFSNNDGIKDQGLN